MKIRTTILLLLITIGLASYVLLHERRQPPRNLAGYLVFDLEGDILAEGKVEAEVKPDDVAGVDFKSGAGNLAFRKQPDGTWDISRGLKDRANPATIATLLDFVAKARIQDTLDDSEITSGKVKESTLGLDDSGAIELTYRKQGGGKLVTLKIGRTAPLGNAMYIRFDGVKTRPDVYVVSPDLHEFLTQPSDAYRDQTLVKCKADEVRKFSVKRGEGVIEVSRPSIKESDGALWTITRPLANARANQEVVGLFLKSLTEAKIQSFTSGSSGASAPAEASIVEITVWSGTDGDKKGATLSFYPDPAPNSKFALCRDSDRRAEFKVDKSFVDELAQIDSPDIFRDLHLGNIDPSKVNVIEVEMKNADSVQLYRIGGSWVVRKTGTEEFIKADETRIVELIKKLNEAEVGFASDTLTDKAAYGFDNPIATLTFSTAVNRGLKQLGGVTTDNSRVLRFGLPPGKPGYANFAGEPYVYNIAPEVLLDIPRNLIRWRTRQLPGFDPQQLLSLRQSIGAAPPVDLTYEPLKFSWTATREGQDVTPLLITQAAEKIAPALGSLEVANWQSESEESSKALAQAPIIIDAAYRAYGAQANSEHTEQIRVEFAPMTADGRSPLYFGRHSKVPGIFLIRAQTVQELAQPLLKSQP